MQQREQEKEKEKQASLEKQQHDSQAQTHQQEHGDLNDEDACNHHAGMHVTDVSEEQDEIERGILAEFEKHHASQAQICAPPDMVVSHPQGTGGIDMAVLHDRGAQRDTVSQEREGAARDTQKKQKNVAEAREGDVNKAKTAASKRASEQIDADTAKMNQKNVAEAREGDVKKTKTAASKRAPEHVEEGVNNGKKQRTLFDFVKTNQKQANKESTGILTYIHTCTHICTCVFDVVKTNQNRPARN